MTTQELRQDADLRADAISAAVAEIAQRHGHPAMARLRCVELAPQDALASVERDRLLADCMEYLRGIASPQADELEERFAALGKP